MSTIDKQIGNLTVQVNEQGYLTDLNQWTREVGEHIAGEEGISMTDKHWEVIDHLQEQERNEVPLTIRKVGKSGVVTIKEFYHSGTLPDGADRVLDKITFSEEDYP